MIDHSSMRLGKRPRRDLRTPKLARYLTAALPPAPASVDYTRGITDWGMMLNDQLGCCTIAAVGHAVQTWTANALGRELTVPDSSILNYYEKWDGYNPGDSNTDQGGVELDVLDDWRKDGFQGVELDAYAAVNVQNAAMVKLAIWLFGGAYIGVELPIRAQDQDVWDVPANPGAADEPGSWGGHAIYLVGYDSGSSGLGTRNSEKVLDPGLHSRAIPSDPKAPTVPSLESPAPSPGSSAASYQPLVTSPSTLTCITWGKPKKMTPAWFEKYCSEAYGLVSKEWLETTGISASGFDLATLEADLAGVTA